MSEPRESSPDELKEALESFDAKIADRDAGNGPVDTIEVEYLRVVRSYVASLEAKLALSCAARDELMRVLGELEALILTPEEALALLDIPDHRQHYPAQLLMAKGKLRRLRARATQQEEK